MSPKSSAAVVIVVFMTVSVVHAQEWTRFRGPNGTGLSNAKTVPTSWTEKDYNWKITLPGSGHSQPVLYGDKVFLSAAADGGKTRFLVCLRTEDGGTVWKKTFASENHHAHKLNGHATSSPVVDAERVYVALVTPASQLVIALDHAGDKKWERELGPFASSHGHGASPIIYRDMLVLPSEQTGDAKSFLIALDAKSGQVRWRTDRDTDRAAYATPCVYRSPDGTEELIFGSRAHGLASIDPATGKSNWEAKVFDKRVCSSPVVAGNVIVATCGSGNGGNFVAAVRAGGKGDVSQSHLVYKITNAAPYVPTPVVRGDRMYLWSDKGIVSCVVASTGKEVWRERVGGQYYGSPICVEDRIYCMATSGEVVVIRAADEFEVLARNDLGEMSHSTPAVAGGRMYLRTMSHLVSIGGEKGK